MRDQPLIKQEFVRTLDHIESTLKKVRAHSGRGAAFSFPDAHKIAEGLFLSAWTHWQEFLTEIFVVCLATDQDGVLRKDVGKFRTRASARRLAERIANHPDPGKWVDWSDYFLVVDRAKELLGDQSPFCTAMVPKADFEIMKRVRNAVAHKSDHSWKSFLKLVAGTPFDLAAKQRKGITAGRFLFSHNWNGQPVIEGCILRLRQAANQLVEE